MNVDQTIQCQRQAIRNIRPLYVTQWFPSYKATIHLGIVTLAILEKWPRFVLAVNYIAEGIRLTKSAEGIGLMKVETGEIQSAREGPEIVRAIRAQH